MLDLEQIKKDVQKEKVFARFCLDCCHVDEECHTLNCTCGGVMVFVSHRRNKGGQAAVNTDVERLKTSPEEREKIKRKYTAKG